MTGESNDSQDTSSTEYADRLRSLSGARWKRVLDVQRPYRWNLHRQGLGRTLDVGCGIGRNLLNLDRTSVGVDHNPDSIAECRARGLTAYTTDEWNTMPQVAVPGSFDSLLVAHVIEHLAPEDWEGLVRDYLPYVRPGERSCSSVPRKRATPLTVRTFTSPTTRR